MTRIRSLLASVLCVIFISFPFLLGSCGDKIEETNSNEEMSESQHITDLPTETETEIETEPPVTNIVFYEGNKSDFTIIRSEDGKGVYPESATALYNKLKNELNITLSISTDWINPTKPSPEKNLEILIGETNRAESISAIEDLDFEGYIVRVTDCKIVIVGSRPGFLVEALHRFYNDIVLNTDYIDGDRHIIPVGIELKEELTYEPLDFKSILGNGQKLSAHTSTPVFTSGVINGYTTAQGAATDGKYVYTVMKKKVDDSLEVDIIIKIDMSTWEIVKKSNELPLDHGNDMTYDPLKNQLVVTNMYQNIVTVIDCETLEIVESTTLQYGTYGVAYIGNGKFAFLGSGLIITDSDFSPIVSYPLMSAPDHVGQGLGADDRYAYVPLSPGSTKNNIIQIYDHATGEYLGIATLASNWESETIFKNGSDFYIQFNHNGVAISTLEFYVPFE